MTFGDVSKGLYRWVRYKRIYLDLQWLHYFLPVCFVCVVGRFSIVGKQRKFFDPVDAGYAPLVVERGVKAFLPRGLVLTFGYTFGVNEAGLRSSSNFTFSSISFILFSRSPNNSSVVTSGALVNPLYWGGNADLNPSLLNWSIWRFAPANKLKLSRQALRASVGFGIAVSSDSARQNLSGMRTSGSMAFVISFWTVWSCRSCPLTVARGPPSFVKKGLVHLFGSNGCITGAKLPIHPQFQFFR